MSYTYNMKKRDLEMCEDRDFIDYIKFWAHRHIKRPIQGFEQKTSDLGGTMDESEQLSQTHHQVVQVACYFYNRGKPLHEIIDILSFFKK